MDTEADVSEIKNKWSGTESAPQKYFIEPWNDNINKATENVIRNEINKVVWYNSSQDQKGGKFPVIDLKDDYIKQTIAKTNNEVLRITYISWW